MIGDLQAKLAALKLPVDLVVLADHGMVTLKGGVDLSRFADLTDVHAEGSLLYAKDEAAAEKLYEQFKADPDARFSVYRRKDVPPGLHYDANPREGDPVIVPDKAYTLRSKTVALTAEMTGTPHGGHGFDPRTIPEMKAIFFAQGPDIEPGVRLPSFVNVNVYPFIARMLGLDAPKVDGRIDALAPALVESIRPAVVVRTRPKLIFRKEVEFSEQARKKKINGTIQVSFLVDTNGVPTHIHVQNGLGYGLDEKAVQAVSQYRFEPATEDGKPVESEVTVEVNFRIF
jgi:TonB family protein